MAGDRLCTSQGYQRGRQQRSHSLTGADNCLWTVGGSRSTQRKSLVNQEVNSKKCDLILHFTYTVTFPCHYIFILIWFPLAYDLPMF